MIITEQCDMLCCAVLCCAVLCCAVLCCAVLCCAVLCGMTWCFATQYCGVRDVTCSLQIAAIKLEERNLTVAYELLARGRSHVPLPELLPILGQLNRDPQLSLIDHTNGVLLLAAIDRDGTGKVGMHATVQTCVFAAVVVQWFVCAALLCFCAEKKDFKGICDILRIRFYKYELYPTIEERFPILSQNRSVCAAFGPAARALVPSAPSPPPSTPMGRSSSVQFSFRLM